MYPVLKSNGKTGNLGRRTQEEHLTRPAVVLMASEDKGSATSQASELGQILHGAGRAPSPASFTPGLLASMSVTP